MLSTRQRKIFVGSFVFTYTATDNGSPAQSGTGTVTVTVNSVNDAPVAGNNSDNNCRRYSQDNYGHNLAGQRRTRSSHSYGRS